MEAAPATRRDRRVRARQRRVLAAAVVVQITSSVITLGLPALVPFVRQAMELTLAQAGLFSSIPALGSFIALFGIGWLVDCLGDRNVLVVGGVVGGLAMLATSLAPTYVMLLALLMVVGIGTAAPTPAGSTAVINEFGLRQRGTAMGIRQAGVPVGGALGALTLAPVAAAWGWRAAIFGAGIGYLVGAVVCWALFPPGLRQVRGVVADPAAVGAPARPLNASLVKASGYGMLMVAGQFSIVAYLSLYLNHVWRVPPVAGALVLAALQLLGAVGRIGWGWVSDRAFSASRSRVLVLVGVVAAIDTLALGWLPNAAPAWLIGLVTVIAGLTAVGWSGVYFTFLAELADPGYEGRSVAFGMTLNQPGIVLGPWAFGLVGDLTRSYRASWTALAVALALAALIASTIRAQRRAPSSP